MSLKAAKKIMKTFKNFGLKSIKDYDEDDDKNKTNCFK